ERRDLAAAGDRGLGAGQRVRRRGRTARRGVRVDAGGVGARCRCAARVSRRADLAHRPRHRDHAGGDAHAGADRDDGAEPGVDVERPLSSGSRRQRTPGDRGLARRSVRPARAPAARNRRDRAARGGRRALAALELHVSAGVLAFGDDLEKLIPPRKPGLAFSLGAMGSRRHNFYNDAYRRAGYAEVATDVQRLWLEGRRDDAAARVPDELVLKANLLGTTAMVRERLALYRRAGITTIRVEPAGDTLDARLANLGRLLELARTI